MAGLSHVLAIVCYLSGDHCTPVSLLGTVNAGNSATTERVRRGVDKAVRRPETWLPLPVRLIVTDGP